MASTHVSMQVLPLIDQWVEGLCGMLCRAGHLQVACSGGVKSEGEPVQGCWFLTCFEMHGSRGWGREVVCIERLRMRDGFRRRW